MDIEINDMFSKKNQELFINKLILDLERNTETFSLSTKNIVMIEIAKLLSSLKKIYNKYSLDIEIESLKDILSNTKDNLLFQINQAITNKMENNMQTIKNGDTKTMNKAYLTNYHKKIDDNEKLFEDELILKVREEVSTQLYRNLIQVAAPTNEMMHQELLEQLNVKFVVNLLKRIKDESIHRNGTLKNMSKETYAYYLDLNKSRKANIPRNKVKKKATEINSSI